MFKNCLLLDPETPIQQLVSNGALLQVVTQSPLEDIDLSSDEQSSKQSEAIPSSSSASSASAVPNLPILTKPHYELVPSLNELAMMSEKELHEVKNVKISMKSVGSIEWEKPVDLCGLNLDVLIAFIIEDGYPSVSVRRRRRRIC